jgi:hypothetical protein
MQKAYALYSKFEVDDFFDMDEHYYLGLMHLQEKYYLKKGSLQKDRNA